MAIGQPLGKHEGPAALANLSIGCKVGLGALPGGRLSGMGEHDLDLLQQSAPPRGAVEWRTSGTPVPYPEAVAFMEGRASAIALGEAPECVWLLEHPELYTAGTSADPAELIAPDRFPVFTTGRGGRFTYHGPGQRVAYVMLDLSQRGCDVRAFVQALEAWMIAALGTVGVNGKRRDGQTGVFVGKAKIASIGVRVRRWVTMHGVSLNVAPDLEHFSGIMPCGLASPVTSLAALGAETDMTVVDQALRETFQQVFGRETVSANSSQAP
jgi:lipoyl(octanoyl) transferase